MINILIADDETRIRSGIKARLKGFELPLGRVFEAADGQAALEIMAQESVDIALVDVNMPFLDGLQFIKQGASLSPGTIFIIISGYNSFEYAQQAIAYGVFRYLLKPIDSDALREAMESAILLIQPGSETTDPMLNEMIRHIRRSYAKSDYSLKTLSQALKISESHAGKALKKGTGQTFNEYLTKIRIENAKSLLDEKGRLARIGEVSARVGFSSQHYFSSVFKKLTGLTPSEYVESKSQP